MDTATRTFRELYNLHLCDGLPDLDAPLAGDAFVLRTRLLGDLTIEALTDGPVTVRYALAWLDFIMDDLPPFDHRFVEGVEIEQEDGTTIINVAFGS